MISKIKRCSLIILFFLLVSCSRNVSQAIPQIEGLTFNHTISLDYATAFRADVYSDGADDFVLLTVLDSDRYLLIPENHSAPENLPPEIRTINLPVKNAYLCASSAMSLIARLGSVDSIRFSAIQKKDWNIEEPLRAIENGTLLYAGKYNSPDFELLLKENCPLAIESTMIYHTPSILEKLESLGITVFVDKSSYEEHPLGRLEWIKLYGLLFGKASEAKSFFDRQVEKLGIHSDSNPRPSKKVSFFYITPTGMVVIRGSDDYIVKMIELAGGKYAFTETRKSRSPSVQISMEQFYAMSADADILIYNSAIDNSIHSKQELIEKNPLFKEFKAIAADEVWATGKYLYQATDRIGDMILDLQKIVDGRGEETLFLERVE
ncbi:ABC transporter substrate-binding protein [uncultured Treponema sp.]|uniref:ABC transporter substrate-binding protein n=1 Tax=uncultured Treponema sp. TaxID=162155 RepID=UPI0025EFEC05|nr:ABC transporter substrate-binding protein [uncultured Treponema sp.]